MKKIALAFLLLTAITCAAQSDNSVYVKSFPGANVGAKVSAAMAACNPDTSVPCTIIIDASLAKWASGSMPSLCSQCTLLDYRSGSGGFPGVSADGANGIKVSGGIAAFGMYFGITTKTANYTTSLLDYTILADTTSAAFTITLVSVPILGQELYIKLINSANTLTITGNGKLIDGAATWAISTPNTALHMQYDGTQWRVL